jgi:hypothetical protein
MVGWQIMAGAAARRVTTTDPSIVTGVNDPGNVSLL